MIELPPKPPQAIPLHVISGLHGSGKTTWIQQRINTEWSGEKLGIILCEEGLVKLDFEGRRTPEVVRLLNACVCCEMAYTFFEVILNFLRDGSIERIVVEIPAQADVRQIFDFINSSHLRDYFRFEPIHLLVDGRNPHMKPEAPSPMVRRLIDQADIFVMSFTDQKRPWMQKPVLISQEF